MFGVKQLAYVIVGGNDLAAWKRFATEILGMQVAASDSNRLLLRMDENCYRVWVEPNKKEDLLAAGWEVENEEALKGLAQRLEQAGVRVHHASSAEADARRVLGLIKCQDPSGLDLEVCYGPLVSYESPFQSPRPIAGFATGGMGMGHITMAVDELERSVSFYRDLLGLRLSDYIVHYDDAPNDPIPQGLKIAFFHCNPRHHSLAIFPAKPPKRLNHIMLQLNSLDDVCSTYYLCQDRKVPLIRSLGRHVNDFMLSFYLKTPSGFGIEYGWGARTVDDANWQLQLHHGSGSIWGHREVNP
jgi:2,3-dihydroxybiphenyl 1,2-dioxygenase